MKKIWQWFKLGILPLFIVSIPIYLFYLIWEVIDKYGFHLIGNSYYDVPVTIAIIIFTACLCGSLVNRPWFENLSKNYLIHLPIIGWMIVVFVLPKRKLHLVEIKTTWGPTPEEGNWEYALETCDPWIEDGIRWHRVHTLGWTGKLFCRIGDANIREINVPSHKAWMTIISMGIL
jgi:hypothetical protein